jgi:Ser/Thr protein kinase RdoA (MazF antagonist)
MEHPAPTSSATDLAPYRGLGPETVLQAAAEFGLMPDGRLLALNSFENRVYQIGVEDGPPLIFKFYRPGRWSDEAILEEHAFLQRLEASELAVIAPLANAFGETLSLHAGYRYAVFRRFGGRPPELEDGETLLALGRLLARVHALGATEPYLSRPTLRQHLDPAAACAEVVAGPLLPAGIRNSYLDAVSRLIEAIETLEAAAGPRRLLRIHGDAHAGNVLVRDGRPWLVDFDDSVTGPAVQDLWMLLGHESAKDERRRSLLLEGYQEFRDFDYGEWLLVEALRARRIVHFAAWVTRRWQDPAFPLAFPWFGTERHWDEHVLCLREQLAIIEQALEAEDAA